MAIIGILVAVLVPKMGVVKASAKMAGVDANARQVQAAVTGLIERYQKMPAGDENATAIAEVKKFANNLASSLQDIVNPFDENYSGAAVVSSGSFPNNTEVAIGGDLSTIEDDGSVNIDAPDTSSQPGQIFVEIATDDYKIGSATFYKITQVNIVPYDVNNKKMAAIEVTP